MNEHLSWWDRFCLRIGLSWEVPDAPAQFPPPPSQPIASSAPSDEGERVVDFVARCMENHRLAVLSVGLDPPWMSDPAYFEREKQARYALVTAAEPLAVILEIPTAYPEGMDWHFLDASIFDHDFVRGAEFMCSGREYFFSSWFFRLDGENLIGSVQLPRHIRIGSPVTGLPPPEPPLDGGSLPGDRLAPTRKPPRR